MGLDGVAFRWIFNPNSGINKWLDGWFLAMGHLLLGIGGLLGGMSFLLDRLRLFGVAFLFFSVSGRVLGIRCLQGPVSLAGISGNVVGLIGVALMLFGVASLLTGIALLYRPEMGQRVLAWLNTQHDLAGAASIGTGDSR
jgi:hypothetical protein